MSKLVTRRPTQGARSKGRPKKTYVDLLEDDIGYAVNDVENSMQDRRLWEPSSSGGRSVFEEAFLLGAKRQASHLCDEGGV